MLGADRWRRQIGALAKLNMGDVATVKGPIAIKVANGEPVIAVEIRSIRSPKSISPKQSGRRSTPMATVDGVERARAAWREKQQVDA